MRNLEQQMTVHGNSPYTLAFPEEAAQTFDVGAPVTLNAAGNVIEAVTPAATVLGVAAMPANGAGASRYAPPPAGKPVTVWVAEDDTLFGINMPGGVVTDIGKNVTVTKVGGLWQANTGTTTGVFKVKEIATLLPSGAVIARGNFIASARQLDA